MRTPIQAKGQLFGKQRKQQEAFPGSSQCPRPGVSAAVCGHFKVMKHTTHSHLQGQIPPLLYPKHTGQCDFGFWSSTEKPSLSFFSFHFTPLYVQHSAAKHLKEGLWWHTKCSGFFTVLLSLINFLAHTLLDGNPTTLNALLLLWLHTSKP